MPCVSPRDLFTSAQAVPAFNFITMEQLMAYCAAAEEQQSGVIVQLSQNAIAYYGGPQVPLAAALAVAEASSAPIAVQLDHIRDPELAILGAELGATSVMFDGSYLNDARNAAVTAEVAKAMHARGVWIEAELGEIGGKNGVHDPSARTDPADAQRFVAETGVDGLAVAVGTSHAMPSTGAAIDLDLLGRIKEQVPVPLVLHGSSGVADAGLVAAVKAGIAKVNVGTRFNGILTHAVREELDQDAVVTDPRKYLLSARVRLRDEAARLITLLK